MKNGKKLREWATPITIGAFALSAVTGIMLFFKVELGLIKHVHEWLSWLLVFGAIFHIIANWRSTVGYISKPVGKGILAFFLLLICLSFIPAGGKHKGPHFNIISNRLIQAPLSEVAQIANHRPDEAMNILKSRGIYTENEAQTVREIAVRNNKSPMDVLDIIF
jgi:hypothetical protein